MTLHDSFYVGTQWDIISRTLPTLYQQIDKRHVHEMAEVCICAHEMSEFFTVYVYFTDESECEFCIPAKDVLLSKVLLSKKRPYLPIKGIFYDLTEK